MHVAAILQNLATKNILPCGSIFEVNETIDLESFEEFGSARHRSAGICEKELTKSDKWVMIFQLPVVALVPSPIFWSHA